MAETKGRTWSLPTVKLYIIFNMLEPKILNIYMMMMMIIRLVSFKQGYIHTQLHKVCHFIATGQSQVLLLQLSLLPCSHHLSGRGDRRC